MGVTADLKTLDSATRQAIIEAVDGAKARGWSQADLREWFADNNVLLADYIEARAGRGVSDEARSALAMVSIIGLPDHPKRAVDGDLLPDVPDEMKAATRWLLWKSIPHDDPTKKRRKVPFYVSGAQRYGDLDSPADLSRLTSYADACAALTSDYAGLGFALGSDGDKYWQGIDLDNLDKHQGLKFVAEDLPGYVERSPSGAGVHAIGYGRPFRSLGSNSTGIEAYGAGRYFTVTGESVSHGDIDCLADFIERRLLPLHSERPQDTSAAVASSGGSLSGMMAQADLRSALASMRSDDRDLWVRMGHALKELGDIGRGLWLEWSQTSDKYDPADAAKVWDGLKGERTGYQAVFAEAQRQGWQNTAKRGETVDDEPQEPATVETHPSFDPWEQHYAPAFPLDALPPILQDFVRYQALSIGADPAAVAMSALAACAGAINQTFRLKMKRTGDWYVRPRLWTVLIGEPSAKKTPVMGVCVKPLRAFEHGGAETYQKAFARWKSDKADGAKEDEPTRPTRYIFNDITTEKLGEILSRQDRGALVDVDELSGWIGAMDKYAGGKGSAADRSFWLQAYNGGAKTIDRLNRGETFIQNLCVSFLGGIQPDRLAQLTDLTSDGLLQRFLPVLMRRASYPQEVENDQPAKEYEALVWHLIGMTPSTLRFDEGAAKAADEFQRYLFDLEQTDGLGKGFCSFVGKLAGVHGSLSAVLHLIEDPENGPLDPIPERVSRAAMRILEDFAIPHALAVYQGSIDGGEWDGLRQIASFVLTSPKARFTTSDFTSNLRFLQGLSVWEVAQKVSALVAGGWLVEEGNHAPAKAWSVVIGLREGLSERHEIETKRKVETMRRLKKIRDGVEDE